MNHLHRRPGRRAAPTALLLSGLLLAALLTACGSGGQQADANAPIKIGVVVGVGTPQSDKGGTFSGVEAGADVINKAGGINGRPIEVVTCNREFNPNKELACIRQAVADGVVAMVGMGNLFNGATEEKLLSDAGIVDLANTGPQVSSYQGDNTYPITWETGTFTPCAGKDIAQQVGAKSVVMVQSPSDVSATFAKVVGNTAKANGLDFRPPIVTAPNVADYSPYVAQAQSSGADIVVLQITTASGPQAFVRAAGAAGATFTICTALGLSGTGGWAGLGAAENQIYVGASFQPLSQGNSIPLLKSMVDSYAVQKAAGDKYADTTPAGFQPQGAVAWLGVHAFAQVAKAIQGDVTAASFRDALAKASVDMGGVIPNVDFTERQSAGPYERVFNSNAYLWKWDPAAGAYATKGSIPDTLTVAGG